MNRPDTEANKCQPTGSYEMPLYSCVQKKRNQKPSVKIEQFNDLEAIAGTKEIELSPTNITQQTSAANSSVGKQEPYSYSRLNHRFREQKKPPYSHRHSHSEPLLNEQPNYRGTPNSTNGRPNGADVRQAVAAIPTTDGCYTLVQVNEGSPPPPLPQRLSCSLELVLDREVEKRGGGGGGGGGGGRGRGGGGGGEGGEATDPTSVRYSTLEPPSLSDALYDEIDISKIGI